MNWFLERVNEPSSINSMFILAGVAGLQVDPHLQASVISAVGLASVLYNFIRKEN